jgi:hypothetical protein
MERKFTRLGGSMDIQTRIQVLEEKHKQLEYDIAWGYSNYLDDPQLKKLKQEKLLVKDQIEELKRNI